MNKVLNRAERLFIEKKYKDALDLYAIALSKDNNLIEAKIGVILSDLGSTFDEEAQVLYYYYQTIKDSSSNPLATIESLVDSLHKNGIDDLYTLLDVDLMQYDGIEYEDFIKIIEEKENFKEAFEDAIFSTKVIISQKWEFVDFIKRLADNGYYSVALDYLEQHAPMYNNDQEILKLYSLLPKGTS